ncbi:MAG: GerMN domain-containing protein [Actinomycetota bacterium]|nr:GerMN domain-containing protein [Actinomycetota bacterium]
MPDRTEDALRAALRSRGEEIRPTPALPGILHRARRGRPARRWLPAVGIAIASVGLVAGAVVVVGDLGTGSGDNPPVAGPDGGSGDDDSDRTGPADEGVVTAPVGSKIPMAIYASAPDLGTPYGDIYAGEFIVTSTGDVGVDAVNALLEQKSERQDVFCNLWSGPGPTPEPVAGVTSVTHLDGLVTVDLDRDVADPFPAMRTVCPIDPQLQQLVHTVTSALRTEDPVLVTINGEPADEVFGVRIDRRPVGPDMTVLRGIRPQTPEQGAVVSGPVTVTGESDTFEANVVVRAFQDGEQVAQVIGMGGSYGEFARYELTLRGLEPGDYTLKTFTVNAAGGGPEAYAEIMYPVYTDITVQ